MSARTLVSTGGTVAAFTPQATGGVAGLRPNRTEA